MFQSQSHSADMLSFFMLNKFIHWWQTFTDKNKSSLECTLAIEKIDFTSFVDLFLLLLHLLHTHIENFIFHQPKRNLWSNPAFVELTQKPHNGASNTMGGHICLHVPLLEELTYYKRKGGENWKLYIYIYQHLPMGAVLTLRDGVLAPLIIHLAPLGRSRYTYYTYYDSCMIAS